MKTLNLVYPEKSDIKYRIDRFPDGQQQVIIDNTPDTDGTELPGYYYLAGKSRIYTLEAVKINARLNNFQDLELIICATKSLRNLGVKEIHLYTPYFLGSRSDRQFKEGSNNYLKDVICPIVNSLNFESVTVLDPHSDVLEACLNNFKKEDNSRLVRFALNDLVDIKNPSQVIFVSPDAGASKKIYKTLEKTGWDSSDIITCSKERDTEGKLTKTVVNKDEIYQSIVDQKDFIIIDDICDGGATFINIVKAIRELADFKDYNISSKFYLIVTHSIFSRGTDELLSYFNGIYTTNSYKEHNNEKIKVLNIFNKINLDI
jgi:ribose-phosphate pyrophosphokinase